MRKRVAVAWCAAALFVLCLTVGFAVPALGAQDADLPELAVAAVDRAPVIDGRLDDACWQRPPDIRQFLQVDGKGAPAEAPTQVWVGRDRGWLFLAFACTDPNVEAIDPADVSRDGPVHRDESVEIFVSPGTDGKTYQHFMLSVGNVQSDNRGDIERGDRHIPWDAHWRSATAGQPDQGRWVAEVAIPLFYFTSEAGRGRWRFNVCRSKWHDGQEAGSWALLSASYHDSARFGVLTGLAGLEPAPVFAPVIAEARIGNMTDLPEREYEVVAEIKNHGAAPGTVAMSAADVTDSTARWVDPNPVRLAAEHQTTAKAWIEFEEYQPRSSRARIVLRDDLGAWRFTRRISWERAQEPFAARMDRSYYTDEDAYFLVYHSPLSANVLEQCRVRVTGDALAEEVVVSPVLPSGRIRLPLVLGEPGSWTVTAALELADGKELKAVPCEVVRRAPKAAGTTVKIDRWRRCVLLDGEPVFPYGFYRAPPENYELMSGIGATSAVVWRPRSPEDLRAALDTAHEHGMKLFTSPVAHATWKYGGNRTEVRLAAMREVMDTNLAELLQPVADHPGLLAYHIWDEPFRTEEVRDGLKAMHDALHELDGYHPVSTGDYIILEKDPVWLDIIDVAFPHHYWLPTGVEKRVDRRYLARLREIRNASRELMKPVWFGMVNEFHSKTRRMMTPRERRLNAYLTLIHEITGLYFFAWPTVHEQTHGAIADIRGEIDVLKPALFSRTPAQTFTLENADEDAVLALLKPHPEGGGVLLVANTLKTPVDLTVSVDGLPAEARVSRLFGSVSPQRTQDGAWIDRLDAYAVRAYRLSALPAAEAGRPLAIRAAVTNRDEMLAGLESRTGAQNPVPNPGFEQEGGWSGIEGNPSVTLDTDFVRSGARALRLERTDASAAGDRVLSEPFVLKPNTRYRIGAWFFGRIESGPKKWGGPNLSVASETVEGYRLNLQTHVEHLQGRWHHRSGHLDVGPEPERIRLRIMAGTGKYSGTAWVDDVYVEELGLERSRNLMPNSGFEYATLPGYPDRWSAGPLTQYLTPETLTPNPDALVLQDKEVKYEGESSLRLRGYNWFHSQPTRANNGVRLDGDTDYVFSCYMKADREDYEVRLQVVDGERHHVHVGTTWERYHIPVHTPKGSVHLHVTGVTLGSMRYDGPAEDLPVLWIDAVQFEKGAEPTEYVPDAYNLSDPSWMSLE